MNFGNLNDLDVRRPITTHGVGARGFNLYDGWLGRARFGSIATSGEGAVGIQVSKAMGALTIDGDVVTSGGRGVSLVKGVRLELSAVALRVTPTGDIGQVSVGGRVATTGDDVTAVEFDGGVRRLDVASGIWSCGRRSDAVHVASEVPGLDTIAIHAVDGRPVVRTSAPQPGADRAIAPDGGAQ